MEINSSGSAILYLQLAITLRAKATLISEPRFSTPATCDFSHTIEGKGHFRAKTLDKGQFSLYRVEKNVGRRGYKIRAHQSVCLSPLALP